MSTDCFQFLLDDVECRIPAIQHAKDNVQTLLEQHVPSSADDEENTKEDCELNLE